MIKSWVKILPYWLVVKLCRGFLGDTAKLIKGNKEYEVRYFQISEGEFVLFNKEIQDIYTKRKYEERKNKLEIKKDKLMKKLRDDYSLKQAVKEEFKQEEYCEIANKRLNQEYLQLNSEEAVSIPPIP